MAALITRMAAVVLITLFSGLDASAWNISTRPFGTVGLKRIGLNLNIPMPDRNAILDLYIRDATCAVGSAGVSAKAGSFIGTLGVEGSTIRNVDVVTPENIPWSRRPLPFTWKGSGFSLWDVDGHLGWMLNQNWIGVLGVRYDYNTVAFGNPVDGAGSPLIPPNMNAKMVGDLIVKTWIPYVGISLTDPYIDARLIYSPFASNTLNTSQTGGGGIEFDAWRWTFEAPGSFLEGLIDYKALSVGGTECGLWCKGSWTKFNGNCNWNGTVTGVPGPTITNISDTATLTKYEISMGLRLEVEL